MSNRKVTAGHSNFSKESYEANDLRAKKALVQFLEKKPTVLSVETNPDSDNEWKFELPDVIAHTDTGDVYMEAQVSIQWTEQNSLPCGRPARWKSFFQYHRKLDQICYVVQVDGRGYWCSLRNDLLYAVLCPMDAGEVKPRKPIKNPRFGRESNSMPYELTHFLDLNECLFMDMISGKIEPFNPKSL